MAQRPDPDRAVYLVDGSNTLYRAFYAIRGLSTSKGLPTNAIYGFTSMLRKLIREHEPRFLGVAFDLAAPKCLRSWWFKSPTSKGYAVS